MIADVPLSPNDVAGKAVLFHTGWDRHWRTDADFEGHPIVEHMRGLAAVPDTGGVFSAVPVKIKGSGTLPVRAFVSAAAER